MQTLLHSLTKENLLTALDKKNKQLTNLALLPGFNFEDLKNSSKNHSIIINNFVERQEKYYVKKQNFRKEKR